MSAPSPLSPEICCAWGIDGWRALDPAPDAVVVVDVLSFGTAVDIALAAGVTIFPAADHGDAARALAETTRAALAGPRGGSGPSLSPRSLQDPGVARRVVLPSPNGGALCVAAGRDRRPLFIAALRNAGAVAGAVARTLPAAARIAVLPAGERREDGSFRFALEDWLGAGAVLAGLRAGRPGARLTAEAEAAAAGFEACAGRLREMLLACESGRELVGRGYAQDVEVAAEFDASALVPQLEGRAVVRGPRGESGSLERRFFEADGRIRKLPAKASDRRLALAAVAARLPAGTPLPEREINERLRAIYPDYCTLRRELVDGGFLSRAAGIYLRPAPEGPLPADPDAPTAGAAGTDTGTPDA